MILITADHGFSYYYNPIREQFVTNFYNETYHIPLAIYDKDLKPMCLDNFFMSKDIFPTILDLAGLKASTDIDSRSLLKFKGRDYALIEYMGGGCPDYYRRNLLMGLRNNKVSFVISIPLDDFKKYKFITFFDLEKDPMEKNNLIYSKFDINTIQNELQIVEKRFENIKKEIEIKYSGSFY